MPRGILMLRYKRHDQFSLISQHQDATGHTMDLESPRILAHANTKQAREFIEAWFSKRHSINRHIDIDPLYAPLRYDERSI